MSALVDPERIEAIVGARRHELLHLGRAVSSEEQVYVMHSTACRSALADLRSCRYSVALDRGIDGARWVGWMDQPVILLITVDGLLVPAPWTRRGLGVMAMPPERCGSCGGVINRQTGECRCSD